MRGFGLGAAGSVLTRGGQKRELSVSGIRSACAVRAIRADLRERGERTGNRPKKVAAWRSHGLRLDCGLFDQDEKREV